jgi:alkanesulfonate monooxygenase SsuD/methylene tetrahydromethanopterin reductase-like flavin-dependent oxidoreductase (luciferase family)
MFTEERATVEGRHYAVHDAVNEPKPIQRPHPPIWIGTQGEKVGLRMVAELADGWNHNRGPEEFEHKLAVLHGHCAKIGRDPKSVRISYNNTCAIYDSPVERRAYVNRYWPGADADKVGAWLESTGVAGSAESVAEQLRFYVDRGTELVVLWFQDLADTGSGESMPERFMREVVPRLRH